MQKILIMTIAMAFVFGLANLTVAETVTRIVGNQITVKDATGKVKTIESTAKGLKVAGSLFCVSGGDRLREASRKFQPSLCRDFPNEHELKIPASKARGSRSQHEAKLRETAITGTYHVL